MTTLRLCLLLAIGLIIVPNRNQGGLFVRADEAIVPDETARSFLWDSERDGWQVGVRQLTSGQSLMPGDPIVLQFALKNTSAENRTVVIQQYDDTYPTLGANGRISINILGSSQRRHQHQLKPGEVLEMRQYRAAFSTEGLPAGKYSVEAQPAFWASVEGEPNRGRGIGRKVPVSFVLGDPATTRISKLPTYATAAERIYWGEPVAGLVVGMRLPDGRREWNTGTTVTGDMFVRNVSDRVIEFDYDVPGPGDWNTHVETPDGGYVQLSAVWMSGFRPRNTRSMTLRPFQQARMFVDEAEQTPDPENEAAGAGLDRSFGPSLELEKLNAESKPGVVKRFSTAGGDYRWFAHVSINQRAVPDLTMIVGCGPVPLTVSAE